MSTPTNVVEVDGKKYVSLDALRSATHSKELIAQAFMMLDAGAKKDQDAFSTLAVAIASVITAVAGELPPMPFSPQQLADIAEQLAQPARNHFAGHLRGMRLVVNLNTVPDGTAITVTGTGKPKHPAQAIYAAHLRRAIEGALRAATSAVRDAGLAQKVDVASTSSAIKDCAFDDTAGRMPPPPPGGAVGNN